MTRETLLISFSMYFQNPITKMMGAYNACILIFDGNSPPRTFFRSIWLYTTDLSTNINSSHFSGDYLQCHSTFLVALSQNIALRTLYKMSARFYIVCVEGFLKVFSSIKTHLHLGKLTF